MGLRRVVGHSVAATKLEQLVSDGHLERPVKKEHAFLTAMLERILFVAETCWNPGQQHLELPLQVWRQQFPNQAMVSELKALALILSDHRRLRVRVIGLLAEEITDPKTQGLTDAIERAEGWISVPPLNLTDEAGTHPSGLCQFLYRESSGPSLEQPSAQVGNARLYHWLGPMGVAIWIVGAVLLH